MVCINSMYVCIRQVGVVSSFPYVHKATTIASLGCSVNPIWEFATSWASCYFLFHSILYFSFWGMHRGAFCKFPFRWIYYCGSNKSTGKETGKTHLCAPFWITQNLLWALYFQPSSEFVTFSLELCTAFLVLFCINFLPSHIDNFVNTYFCLHKWTGCFSLH